MQREVPSQLLLLFKRVNMFDMSQWRWPDFKPEEVLSPNGLSALDRGVMVIQPILLDKLTELKKTIGHPILINHRGLTYRGYRSPYENYKIVKGETYSYHMQGLAADCSCVQISVAELKEIAEKLGFKGIGFYESQRFVHLDMRERLQGGVAHWEG